MSAIKKIFRIGSILSLIVGILLTVNGVVIYKNMKDIQALQQQGSQFILLHQQKIESMISIDPKTQKPTFTSKENLQKINAYEQPLEIYLTSAPHNQFIVLLDAEKTTDQPTDFLKNKKTTQEEKDLFLLTTLTKTFNIEDPTARIVLITQIQEGSVQTYPEIKAIQMTKLIPQPLLEKTLKKLLP
jgi:hypothetical protein